ncbi:MAG: ROK family protein [Pseudanabaenaceae cyanobacterium bins.39]|nr:ROK family protein [Pseudanabaenaceae cyanobacterium bins.39]
MGLITLAIDVGGTGIKAMLLQENGEAASWRSRIETPHPASPDRLVPVLVELALQMGECDRIAIGFPSVVEAGITRGAINLHPAWDGFPLAKVLQTKLGKPLCIANDADVQGYGAIAGRGVELTITLGTGFGSALFVDGRLLPNLELGQHLWQNNLTYEDWLGQSALEKMGIENWQQKLGEAIAALYKLFNFDHLYIGGGNARLLGQDWVIKLPSVIASRLTIVSNDLGLLGGLALWRFQGNYPSH